MKKLKTSQDLLQFKSKYEKLSGLNLPMNYLKNADVYAFKKTGKIIGGFILNSRQPYRTIDIFISESRLDSIAKIFEASKYCEVCCFWIERTFRKKSFYNAKFWLQMAYKIQTQHKDVILFGTNSRGLAKMYGFPSVSLLFHKDKIKGRDTFVFIARRKDFISGILEIVYSKIFHKKINHNNQPKNNLKKAIFYELSK